MVRGPVLFKLRQEGSEQLLLCLLSGLDGIIKQFIAAQMVAFSLEANRRPPCPLSHIPVHAWHTAGIVAPPCAGPNHLHAGAVHVGQTVLDSRPVGAAAADSPPIPEATGFDYDLVPAVTPAQPGSTGPDILRRGQDGEFPEPLSGQIELFRGVMHVSHTSVCG